MLTEYSQINTRKTTSKFLQEYVAIKDKNLDSIVLFQIGDFYETFFEDAKELSEATGLIAGTRKIKGIGDIIQCGFRTFSLNTYLGKLLDKNYKVCLCEQFKIGENKYLRKVTRQYTPGTIIENEFLDSFENNFLLSLKKTTGKNNYAISYADVSTGQFYCTSDKLEVIKEEIEKINPNELLILDSEFDIFEDLVLKYETTILNDVKYKNLNTDEIILKYCKETQRDFNVELDKITEYKISNFLTLDEVTRRSLELTRTKRLSKKKGSIIWFLNYTNTPMGARMLKKYLSEPLLDIDKIIKRQAAIEELIKNKKALKDFESTLCNFADLSRLCAKISNTTIYPKDLFVLAKNANPIKKIYTLSKKMKSESLKLEEYWYLETLELVENIKDAICKNAPQELKSGGIINEGYNTSLDYLRNKLKNTKTKISNYEKKQIKKLAIDKLKIKYSNILGYYIEIPTSKSNSLSDKYLRKQTLQLYSRYTTQELKDLEAEISSLTYQINQLEYALFCDVRKMAASFVEKIRKFTKDVARIDVLVSLARCAITNNLTKPNFNKQGIYIENGFHPSLLKLKNELTKNPTSIDNNTAIILTGANMSGKSTYLKYNAIITLLAQIGSFVPADFADLTIIDKIFVRQGSTDDIVNNNSTFMVEMNDLKFIIDNTTKNSYILLDEPAKSTNSKEGAAITKAFVEYIITTKQTKMLIVTHNFALTSLEEKFPNNISNYIMGNPSNSSTIIDRKIQKGCISSSCALNTAMLANLPSEIIESAKRYLENNV